MKNRFTLLCLSFSIGLAPAASAQQDTKPVQAQVVGNIMKPARKPVSAENMKKLKLPDGFEITKFAEKLGKPRMLAISDAGNVYVTRREEGDVVLLRDNDNDGKADENKTVAKLRGAHGITMHQGKAYIATVTEVYEAEINKDGTLSEPRKIMENLPDGGQHPNRTLRFGPDGKLYVSVGSSCNACAETNPEHATMLVADADGKNRRVFAKGLRNTIGFDWHPETREMYGMDHGIDWLGDNEQHEELNKLVDGGDYGWPYIYDDGKHNPGDQPKDMTYQQYAAKTTNPELMYTAHSSPLDMIFYKGAQFPKEYINDAFVTMHGSWNRAEPTGYKIVRVRFQNGKPTRFDDFLTGFLLTPQSLFGRPVGLAQHPDGSLFFSDDSNGVVYKVTYTGNDPKQKGKR